MNTRLKHTQEIELRIARLFGLEQDLHLGALLVDEPSGLLDQIVLFHRGRQLQLVGQNETLRNDERLIALLAIDVTVRLLDFAWLQLLVVELYLVVLLVIFFDRFFQTPQLFVVVRLIGDRVQVAIPLLVQLSLEFDLIAGQLTFVVEVELGRVLLEFDSVQVASHIESVRRKGKRRETQIS